MFHVGDLIIYSAHGVCQIDDICDKSFSGETRTYYVMHPLEDPKLTINIPTDRESITVLSLIDENDAGKILDSFGEESEIQWVENSNQRAQYFHQIINTGNRKDIIKLVNTLVRKKQEAEMNGKKFGQTDQKVLNSVQKILFVELAIALNTTVEAIEERVADMIQQQI
jgi:CarD family transcriptional regulator